MPSFLRLLQMIFVTALILSTFSSSTEARESDGFRNRVSSQRANFQPQLKRLAEMGSEPSPQSCQARYDTMWNDGTLRIDWFYGYISTENSTAVVDQLLQTASMNTLLEPCRGGLTGVCGFQFETDLSGAVGPITISKSLGTAANSPRVIIRFWTSSASPDDRTNREQTGLLVLNKKAQAAKTRATTDAFLRSFHEADVVIYDGHSNYGNGLGFGAFGIYQYLKSRINQSYWEPMVKAASQFNSKVSVVALAACKSAHYYLPSLHKANPRLAIAAAEEEQGFSAGEESVLGLIDAILARRCESGINEALQAPFSANDSRDASGGFRIHGF